MRNIIVFLLLFVQLSNIQAQTNFGKRWVIAPRGYNIGFNQPIDHDTSYVLGDCFFVIGNHSNISDSSGNLLFSSDGMDIFDKNFQLLADGDTLVPNIIYNQSQGFGRAPQTSLILPMENKKYYVITPTVSDAYYQNVWLNKPALNWNFDLLLYHVVDMNANGGLGKVVEKKKPLLQNTPMKKSQMMACRHANGKDWWLLKMAGDTNMVFTFLVQQDTILRYPNQYIPFPLRGTNDVFGQMKFTRDGTRWATTYDAADDVTYKHHGDVYVADFDRCTGMLSSFQNFIPPPYIDTGNGGMEFSPNGQFLYVTKYNGIQQLDINAGTWYTVTGPDTNAFCGYTTMELAPDNRIYIGRAQGTCKQMSVINSPNIKFNCDFCPNCLRSKSNWGYFSTPPCMPNYELGTTGQPCWPLGNEELRIKDDELQAYPNPASTVLYIQHARGKKKELYNSLGQLIVSTTQDEINVMHLSKGVYYLRCEHKSKKVIIE